MGFWIFMLISDLLIPLTMISFGKYFMKKAPKEINMVFGYRTPMSTKNQDTWNFAHQYFGKIWYRWGWGVLLFTVIALIFVIGKDENCVGNVGGAVCFAQLLPMMWPIIPTEIALRKKFDKNGERR